MAKEYTVIDTLEVTRVIKVEEAPACFKGMTDAIPAGYASAVKEKLNADGVVVTDRKVFEKSDESEYHEEKEADTSEWALTNVGRDYTIFQCKRCCGYVRLKIGEKKFQFCPHCGRYMMGVE